MSEADDALFAWTSMFPRRTMLPMTVWAGPRGKARHAARIKVNMTHGATMDISNTAIVAIEPVPRLIAGYVSVEFSAVAAWIALNHDALMAHWNGEIDGGGMAAATKPLP